MLDAGELVAEVTYQLDVSDGPFLSGRQVRVAAVAEVDADSEHKVGTAHVKAHDAVLTR